LDALASAVINAPDKGEGCGSKGACTPLDSANRLSLWLSRALQGEQPPYGAQSAVLAGA